MKVTDETKRFARKTLKWLRNHPENHDQGNFISGRLDEPNLCGTTMCVAGTVVYLKYGLDAKKIRRYVNEGRAALGLSLGEAEVLFYEMDEGRALAKLEKVANGEQFTEEDFKTASSSGEDASFDSWAWDMRDDYDY